MSQAWYWVVKITHLTPPPPLPLKFAPPTLIGKINPLAPELCKGWGVGGCSYDDSKGP